MSVLNRKTGPDILYELSYESNSMRFEGEPFPLLMGITGLMINHVNIGIAKKMYFYKDIHVCTCVCVTLSSFT